jgi:hypothetical protein
VNRGKKKGRGFYAPTLSCAYFSYLIFLRSSLKVPPFGMLPAWSLELSLRRAPVGKGPPSRSISCGLFRAVRAGLAATLVQLSHQTPPYPSPLTRVEFLREEKRRLAVGLAPGVPSHRHGDGRGQRYSYARPERFPPGAAPRSSEPLGLSAMLSAS